MARSLGLPALVDTRGRRSIATSFPASRRRTGIYLLAFAEGSYYVGLARDVVRRFSQHRRAHGDRILALAFRQTPLRDLENVERELIRHAERMGVPLEQTEWKTEVYGGSDLDDMLPAADFERWCCGPSESFAREPWIAPRFEPGRRARDERRLAQLLAHPQGLAVL